MHRLPAIVCLGVLVVWSAGCSGGPRMRQVSGQVTLDGKPVPEGDILFKPAAGSLGPDAGRIRDGMFAFLAKEGKHRVEISASRILPGGARGAGGEPVPEEYIPERYHSNSELTAEVTSAGPNRFDFKLVAARKK